MVFKQVISKYSHFVLEHNMLSVLRTIVWSRCIWMLSIHMQTQMPHLRNVIATQIEEGKINDQEIFQSSLNTANESTHITTSDTSDPSNSPTSFTTGKHTCIYSCQCTWQIYVIASESSMDHIHSTP